MTNDIKCSFLADCIFYALLDLSQEGVLTFRDMPFSDIERAIARSAMRLNAKLEQMEASMPEEAKRYEEEYFTFLTSPDEN